jgi:hypothetical protein
VLEAVKRCMDEAVILFPGAREIVDLRTEITQEWLLTAVDPTAR